MVRGSKRDRRGRKKRRQRRRRGGLVLMVPVLLILLIGGGIVAMRLLLSGDVVKARLIEAVRRETGRDLVIGNAAVSLWPRLSVRLRAVRLSDPPWIDGGRGTFLQVERVDLVVALRPLLSRRIDVRRIDLVAPNVNLRVDAKGRVNWDVSRSADGEAGDAVGATKLGENGGAGGGTMDLRAMSRGLISGLRLAPVHIRDGRASFHDARTGTRLTFTGLDLTLAFPTPRSPLNVQGSLIWRERPVKLSLFIRAPRRLAGQGSAVEAVISAPEMSLSYQGLVRLRDGLELAGRTEAAGPSLRRLLSWIGSPVTPGRGLGAFSLKGAIAGHGGTFELREALATLDGMRGQGTLRLRFGGERPYVAAALGVDRIDANVYLAPATAMPTTGAEGGRENRRGVAADWSDAPIDFAALAVLDADLRLVTNAIRWRRLRIGRTTLSATLRRGRLEAHLSRMAFYDSAAAARLVLDGSRRMPAISGSLRATGLNGEALLRDVAGVQRIRGQLSLELTLATTGHSQREMIARLKGDARIAFRDGAIRGIDVARLVRTVRQAVIEGWRESPREKTDFTELSATFRIADGIAVTRDLKLLSPLVRLTGAGEVDLLRRRIDLKVEPKLVASLKGQGGKLEENGLPVPVIVRGPWDAPRIYPDIEGILKDPAGAYERLRSLLRKGGAQGAAKELESLKRKAGEAVGRGKRRVERAVRKHLKGAIGQSGSEKAGKKPEKGAGKRLRDLLRR